jgi:RNA polymerase sigma factor (sigma-70 family)
VLTSQDPLRITLYPFGWLAEARPMDDNATRFDGLMDNPSPELGVPTPMNPDDYAPPLTCEELLERLSGRPCPAGLDQLLRADPGCRVRDAVANWVYGDQKWKETLFRVARRGLGSNREDDVESVVADAVIDVIQIVSSGGVHTSLKALLRQMVAHRAISWGRPRKNRPLQSLPAQMDFPSYHRDVEYDRERLLQAIERLPPSFREVIDYHYLRELTVEQIASELQVSVGTVKSRLHRSRRDLREMLGGSPDAGL